MGMPGKRGPIAFAREMDLSSKRRVDASIANLVRRCDGAARLRDLVASLAQDANVPFEAISQGSLNVMRSMLRKGFLTFPE